MAAATDERGAMTRDRLAPLLPTVFRVLFALNGVQLPAWLLVGLNAFAFHIYNEFAFSVAYLVTLLLSRCLYRRSHRGAGLSTIVVTSLVTLYFWYAVLTGAPL